MAKSSSYNLFNEDDFGSTEFSQLEEELELQEALLSSLMTSQMTIGMPEKRNPVKKEAGESSKSSCQICMEQKSRGEMFRSNNCNHSFCSDCMGKHIITKIQDNIHIVTCPGYNCETVLDPEACRSIIPDQVFDRWGNALCESSILNSQKIYCPYCSSMLVDDGGEVIRESECPNCYRLFCAQCKVPWHSGISCEEFQKLGIDERGRGDLMLLALAKKSKWRKCPNCKVYVEKTDGCLHITCRCGCQFCYGCGSIWTPNHGNCRRA